MPDSIANIRIPLGNISVLEKIGEGGFGEVYRAKLEPFERDFAIKILNPHPSNADLPVARDRFIQEAEFLMNLRHPHITPIYGVGEFNASPYILMELFEGTNLHAARSEAAGASAEKFLPFIERVVAALGHAHSVGIVHRDIKPSNLLTKRGDARVVDFGIAAIMDPDSQRFTKAGATPVGDAFAAPELLENPRLVDARCDIYSLGACWFWLLTGRTPSGLNWEYVLRSVKGMTPKYESILLKTMDEVDNRFQTMDELAQALRSLSVMSGPAISSDEFLDDHSCLLLGVIFEHSVPSSEPISVYHLEQQVALKLSKLQLGLSLRTIRAKALVENCFLEQDFGERYAAIRLLESGEQWVDANRHRVERLLTELRKKNDVVSEILADDDDIPF